MNIDKFLDRHYSLANYNCGHYVAEIYKELAGDDIYEICGAFNRHETELFASMLRSRKKLSVPITPCIVFMRINSMSPHAGVYINNRVLHLSSEGPRLEHMDILQALYKLSFYK